MPARLDEVLKAAGEPTRLRILNLLRNGTTCVCDIQSLLGVPQPTVSRHLAALRHAGLVEDSRQGTRVMYSLAHTNEPAVAALHELLNKCVPCESFLQADLELLRRVK
jgi:ArsR family transcriptional regulator, arsenate/arsenite/antimonite-responsive transcriptional repressor